MGKVVDEELVRLSYDEYAVWERIRPLFGNDGYLNLDQARQKNIRINQVTGLARIGIIEREGQYFRLKSGVTVVKEDYERGCEPIVRKGSRPPLPDPPALSDRNWPEPFSEQDLRDAYVEVRYQASYRYGFKAFFNHLPFSYQDAMIKRGWIKFCNDMGLLIIPAEWRSHLPWEEPRRLTLEELKVGIELCRQYMHVHRRELRVAELAGPTMFFIWQLIRHGVLKRKGPYNVHQLRPDDELNALIANYKEDMTA